MENQSFRDILAQFLERGNDDQPVEAPISQGKIPSETPFFIWENQAATTAKPKSTYPKPEMKTKSSPEVKPVLPAEPKWAIFEFSLADQRHIKKLVQMGATEINGEISLSKLKKAHRRLAKQLHPDVARNEKSQEDFLALQSIYESLCESIKALAKKAAPSSATANGSESASAPKSRRQGAA